MCMRTQCLVTLYQRSSGIVEMDNVGFLVLVVNVRSRRLGILLGLVIHVQRSIVLVSLRCNMLVSVHSSKHVMPTIRSINSVFQAQKHTQEQSHPQSVA